MSSAVIILDEKKIPTDGRVRLALVIWHTWCGAYPGVTGFGKYKQYSLTLFNRLVIYLYSFPNILAINKFMSDLPNVWILRDYIRDLSKLANLPPAVRAYNIAPSLFAYQTIPDDLLDVKNFDNLDTD